MTTRYISFYFFLFVFFNLSIQIQSVANTSQLFTLPKVIINEISNGDSWSREYVELLVIGEGDCNSVDLRGYIIDDNNSEFSDDASVPGIFRTGVATGHVRFKDIPRWENVPVGSLILIYNNAEKNTSIALTDDPSDNNSDRVYILPINDSGLEGTDSHPGNSVTKEYLPSTTNYSSANWETIAMHNRGDGFQIRYPDGSYCHGISYGGLGKINGGPDNLHISETNGYQKTFFFSQGDFLNKDYYTGASAYSGSPTYNETPGAPNNALNQNYILNLCEDLNPCEYPVSQVTVDDNSGDAFISWDEIAYIDNYQLQYRIVDSGDDWEEIEVNTHFYSLSNLENETTYEYRIIADCPDGWQDWEDAPINSFTTSAGDPSDPNNPNNTDDCINPSDLQDNTLEVCYGETITFCPEVGDNCVKWLPASAFPSLEETTYPQPTTIEITESITITLIETNDGDIINQTEIELIISDEFTVELPESIEICKGEMTSIEPMLSGGSGNYSYTWSNGKTSSLIVETPEETTTFELTVEDLGSGCGVTAYTTVVIEEAPLVFISSDYYSVCQSDLTFSLKPNGTDQRSLTDPCDNPGDPIILIANIDGETSSDLSYSWSYDPDLNTSNSLAVNEAGTYSVTITNTMGCTATASFDVGSCAQASIEQGIQVDDNGILLYQLTAIGSAPGYSFEWSSGNGNDDNSILVSKPGIYSVIATSPEGCKIKKTFDLEAPCEMPTQGLVRTPHDVGLLIKEGTKLDFFLPNESLHGLKTIMEIAGDESTVFYRSENTQFGGYKQYTADGLLTTAGSIYEYGALQQSITSIYDGNIIYENDKCKCKIERLDFPSDNTSGLASVDGRLPLGFPEPDLLNTTSTIITEKEIPCIFCGVEVVDVSNDNLVDIILNEGESNNIIPSNLTTFLGAMPSYFQTNQYDKAAYYLYNKQDGSLKIYRAGTLPTIVPPNEVRDKLMELPSVPSDLDYIAFLELDNSNSKNLRFEFFTRAGAWMPKEGPWQNHDEGVYKALVESEFKQWFKELDNIDDPVYNTQTYQYSEPPSSNHKDGELKVLESKFFKALAAAADLVQYAIVNAETKPTFWNPTDSQYANKPFHVPVPIAGVFDQAVLEIKELKELIGLVIQVGKDPMGVVQPIYDLIINLQPSEIVQLILDAVYDEIVNQWTQLTDETYIGTYYRSRAVTKTGAKVFEASLGGGIILVFLDKVIRTVKFLRKFTNTNLKNKLNGLSATKAEKFLDDFEDLDQDAIDAFNGNENLVDSWETLIDFPILRLNPAKLKTVDDFAIAKNIDKSLIKTELDNLPSHKEDLIRAFEISNGTTAYPTIANKGVIQTDGNLLGRLENGQFVPVGNAQAAGTMDYVVKQNGEILLGSKHTFLSNGDDVLAAGTVKFNVNGNGTLSDISNASGHYLPTPGEAMNFLKLFKSNGVDTQNTFLTMYNEVGTIFKQVHPNANARKLYE